MNLNPLYRIFSSSAVFGAAGLVADKLLNTRVINRSPYNAIAFMCIGVGIQLAQEALNYSKTVKDLGVTDLTTSLGTIFALNNLGKLNEKIPADMISFNNMPLNSALLLTITTLTIKNTLQFLFFSQPKDATKEKDPTKDKQGLGLVNPIFNPNNYHENGELNSKMVVDDLLTLLTLLMNTQKMDELDPSEEMRNQLTEKGLIEKFLPKARLEKKQALLPFLQTILSKEQFDIIQEEDVNWNKVNWSKIDWSQVDHEKKKEIVTTLLEQLVEIDTLDTGTMDQAGKDSDFAYSITQLILELPLWGEVTDKYVDKIFENLTVDDWSAKRLVHLFTKLVSIVGIAPELVKSKEVRLAYDDFTQAVTVCIPLQPVVENKAQETNTTTQPATEENKLEEDLDLSLQTLLKKDTPSSSFHSVEDLSEENQVKENVLPIHSEDELLSNQKEILELGLLEKIVDDFDQKGINKDENTPAPQSPPSSKLDTSFIIDPNTPGQASLDSPGQPKQKENE